MRERGGGEGGRGGGGGGGGGRRGGGGENKLNYSGFTREGARDKNYSR